MKKIVLVLHNIRSLHNVGSAFRTADAAGVKKIYLSGITPSPIDRLGRVPLSLAKVALGAEKTVPWEHVLSLTPLVVRLKKNGYEICAVEQSVRARPYHQFRTKKNVALVFGNEVSGLAPTVVRLADAVLEIPMRGALVRDKNHPRRLRHGKESLNVSVAIGIVIYRLRLP